MTLKYVLLCGSCAILIAGDASAQIVFRGDLNRHVRGLWLNANDGTVEVYGQQDSLDIDEDGHADLRFEHEYVHAVQPAPAAAVPYVASAIAGLSDIRQRIPLLTSFAMSAANTGVNDGDFVAAIQAAVDNTLDDMDRIAHTVQYNDHKLLDGSSGVVAEVDTNSAYVVHTGAAATPGVYPLQTIHPAERAVVNAITTQTRVLAEDEILTINGINITLSAGLSPTDIANRLNEFTQLTGAYARLPSKTMPLQLATVDSGTSLAQLSVVSNRAAADNSSGFGTTLLTDVGSNAQVSVGPQIIDGDGNAISIHDGPLAGTKLFLDFFEPDGYIKTQTGHIGNIVVNDQSLEFEYRSGAIARISFPNADTDSLGFVDGLESSGPLGSIAVTSHLRAQQAISVIKAADWEISAEIDRLRALQFGAAVSHNALETLSGSQFMVHSIGSPLLETGQMIGPQSDFTDNPLSLPPNVQGYLGVRLPDDRYGWLRIGTDHDRGILVYDAAWQQTPGQAISAGSVPEPASRYSIGLAVLVGTFVAGARRRRCSPREGSPAVPVV
ncbi:MAG: hypothetical protein R3E01_03565 [Pirellulaceae bacterium]